MEYLEEEWILNRYDKLGKTGQSCLIPIPHYPPTLTLVVVGASV